MRYLASMAVVSLALTGPALTAAAKPFQFCLRQNQVNGWKVIDDQTLIVDDRIGNRFKVLLAPGCHGLRWPMHLGFNASTHLSCIGRHDFLIVPPNGPNVRQRCLINDVMPYIESKPN